jgi:thiamine biosynthesis protein ThiI
MSDTDTVHILLRWAELFLKGNNRPWFEQQLVSQAARLVQPVEGAKVHRGHARVYVEVPRAGLDAALARLEHLFGIVSMSPAFSCERTLDGIGETALAVTRDLLARRGGPLPTFKVETNRPDKTFPHTSIDVSRAVGGKIHETLGLPVDVHAPQVTVGVEIGFNNRTFVWCEVIPASGGLPVGVTGRVNLLISGGIDSPVAGWLAMKRGCALSCTYFHSFPFTGDRTKEKVIELVRVLAPWQGSIALHVVNFTDVQKRLRETGPAELAVVLYRRMMVRAAARVAAREKALALVTGENLAQVASQTLENMAAIEDASPLPVLRPLLTNDKLETVALAQKIGTYDISIQPYDDCCSLFLPPHPATRARVSDARRAEQGLDVEAMADSLADTTERIVVE